MKTMKTVLVLFLGLILLPITTQAANFKEGDNYQVIKQTSTASPEVREFFSFYCGHCRAFEPYIKELKANLINNVKFEKNHVNFLGGKMGVELTKAYAAAKILQVEDKFADLVFNWLQVQRKPIKNEQDILTLFEKTGITKKEAQAALQSFPVIGLASQMKRKTETFAIRGVPTLIVNGKYLVNRGSVKSEQELIDLVNYLSQKQD